MSNYPPPEAYRPSSQNQPQGVFPDVGGASPFAILISRDILNPRQPASRGSGVTIRTAIIAVSMLIWIWILMVCMGLELIWKAVSGLFGS